MPDSRPSSPLFSFVLPTYNVEKYVERCILSLQAQDDADFEMVFVDDCGQDRSLEIVERHAATDPRIRIVRYGANKGTFAARHEGVKAAVGKYVFFVDPDDEIAPNALSTLRRVIDREAPDLIVTGIRIMRTYKWYQKRIVYPVPRSAAYPDIMKAAFLDIHPWWGTPGKVYLREPLLGVLAEFEHVDGRLLYGEDMLVYVPFANIAKKMAALPEELYWYHLNDTSITQIASRSRYVWQLVQSDRIVGLLEAKISAGHFAGPHAEQAARRVKHLFLKNTRGVCLGLLQDMNRNLPLGLFSYGGWRWTLRIIVFMLTFGKRGLKIWERT